MKAKFITNRGKVRKNNEDAGGLFYNKDKQLLAIVADGMGGHLAGEVASKLAVSHAKESWEKVSGLHTAQATEEWLKKLIVEMNALVYNKSLEEKDFEGMGTTVVITICTSQFATIGHVGDSRCYVKNAEGFKQLTEDHSYVNELVRTGEISPNDAENHPRKNVLLHVVGTDETIKMAVKTIGFEKNDLLFLCSDGLYEKVANEEIVAVMKNQIDFAHKWSELVDLANERGGEDNITLAAILYDDEVDKVGEPPC